jgi:hypothetical protein
MDFFFEGMRRNLSNGTTTNFQQAMILAGEELKQKTEEEGWCIIPAMMTQ